MRGNRNTHRPSGFHGRGIQPLRDTSPAQRMYVNQGSAVSSSLAHNAQDRARAHEPERHHNDHDSEGNWHGLPDLLENDKKDLTIPTLKLWDQVNSIAVTPRIDESTPPPTDIALSIIPTLQTTEEGKLPHLHEQQSKAVPMDKMKNTRLPPIARRRDTHLSILEMDSSSAKDCSDKYEDDYVTPVQHPTKTKSRARLG